MNQNWKDFLQQNGAEFIVNSAGNSSQPETSVVLLRPFEFLSEMAHFI